MKNAAEQHEANISNIYGTLFSNYNEPLFEDSVELFFKRHRMWDFDLSWFKNKSCLDAGCGGGRYLVALSRLGASEVVGIDISEGSIITANERLQKRGLKQARAQMASVLDIPFPDSYFDYVVCSGVIHHTPDPHKAFQELTRVLKPGGLLFLSVYGRGGLKWFTNDLFRYTICKIVPFKTMEFLWRMVGIPANKRYNILDNLYVKYCHRFTEREVRGWLQLAGFENITRVKLVYAA